MHASDSLAAVQSRVTEPLARVLRWMTSHRDSAGAMICPEHRIEHTGKSAGAVVLAVELARLASGSERDAYVAIARQQCERIVSRLEREGDSTCFTFRPGRHDPYNCSNSVIDGGACADALATCVLELADELSEEERKRFTDAAVLHAQTYLRYAIVDKGVPAQCAWAMTGAAQAYRLSGHEVLQLSCSVGAERLRSVQRDDGSHPYHAFGAAHEGSGEASAYYHSRVPAFVAFALEHAFGPEIGVERDTGFAAALDFLHGITGPDGIKTGAIEAKPWYFGSTYEVASNPFDIAAFATEWRRTRAPRAAAMMRASYRAWLEHLGPDGAPRSHLGRSRRSYQCPMFWAAHACWIARSIPELVEALAGGQLVSEGLVDRAPGEPGTSISTHFAGVDLVRMESAALVVWIRGKRLGGNASHGSVLGGGLVRVFSKALGSDLFVARRFERRPEASWSGRLGLPSLARGLRAGAQDVRFSGWLMRNRFRGRSYGEAVREPLRALRRSVVDYAAGTASTAFDRGPTLTLVETDDHESVKATMSSAFALREGTVRVGQVERSFELVGNELVVEERCLEATGLRGLWFRMPERAVVLEESANAVKYAFRG